MPSYIARPHVLADEFVPGYLGDSFGLFPFVHGDPLANQFDGPFLVRLIRKEVTHTSGFSFGIESRDPDIPSCWLSGTMRGSCCWSSHNQAGPLPGMAGFSRFGSKMAQKNRKSGDYFFESVTSEMLKNSHLFARVILPR